EAISSPRIRNCNRQATRRYPVHVSHTELYQQSSIRWHEQGNHGFTNQENSGRDTNASFNARWTLNAKLHPVHTSSTEEISLICQDGCSRQCRSRP
ncbi:unnamed protein product, partial [Aphanomyces euteiches]